jgi:hypothetical protein
LYTFTKFDRAKIIAASISDKADANMITKDQITNAIPETLRPFLIITVTSEIPDKYVNTIKAFFLALHHFYPAVQNWRQVFIHFGESPFVSESSVARVHLTLADAPPPVALCWYDTIYFDVKRLDAYAFDYRVAAFMEELCHVFLNVKSEPLAKTIVSHLYSGVRYENGDYQVDTDR